MSNDLETFYPQSKKIKIVDKDTGEILDFEINEFVFDNRVKFVRMLTDIFSVLSKNPSDLKSMQNSEIFSLMIETAGEKLGPIYSLVLDKPIEWIRKNLTLRKEIELIMAIFEVNDIPLLLSQIRKLIPQSQKQE